MAYSDDAAEQVVKIALEGTVVAARITGEGAKQVAILLYALLKDQKRTRGKTTISNLLRSGSELKVFAVRDQDLEKFCRQAKEYGILYCVLKDKDANDGITEIMVKAEQAGQVNRIFERYNLTTVDMASVRSEIERAVQERPSADVAEPLQPQDHQAAVEAFVDALLVKPEQERDHSQHPTMARREAESLSAPQSEMRDDTDDRPSIRKELQEIRAELAASKDAPHLNHEKIHLKPKER